MRVGINLIVSLFVLWWVSSSNSHTPVWLYANYFLCFDTTVLNLSLINRYFTAGKIVEKWTSLAVDKKVMLYFCVISVSVDKLEAVPILCVERLVSPLFCMNDSQSVIISLWRTVPIWFCPFWDMTVFIRQDYSQYKTVKPNLCGADFFGVKVSWPARRSISQIKNLRSIHFSFFAPHHTPNHHNEPTTLTNALTCSTTHHVRYQKRLSPNEVSLKSSK